MKRVLLVRHGESEWNHGRRLQGQADIGLSARGVEQATALAATVRALAPDLVVSSDLERARHTSQLLGYEPRLDPRLREVDVGDWTGLAIAEIVATVPEQYRDWRAGEIAPPDGELWEAFVSRTAAAVTDALSAARTPLVVCHGGVIRALLQHFLGLAPKQIIPVGPASLTVLAQKAGEDGMRLEVFNFSPGGPLLNAPD